MSALAQALAYIRLIDGDATLALLRADNAPVIMALLATHLGGETRRRPADELYELIDAELDSLRDHFDLPGTGKSYGAAWRRAGWLIRRTATDARGETLELSPEALAAIRIADQIATPRQTATESRLMSIRDQLRRLAAESDPDVGRRLEQLERERAEIEARIARIRDGADVEVLEAGRARERFDEILRQAEDVPADFGRVRKRFEELNHELRVGILESDDAQRTVLDNIFRGVDLIESSDEGATFSAFSALILDPELAGDFERDIRAVLDRDFAGELPLEQRRFLRGFLRTLSTGSSEIHGVLTDFARGLRRYVHSQDYQRDRVLRRSLRVALAEAVDAAEHLKPFQLTGQTLALSSVALTSVGAISLHDPGEYASDDEIIEYASSEADLEALRLLARETEIDFDELSRNINELLAAHKQPLTVAQVLAERPASQGIASVIGLVSLAARHGNVDADAVELLRWTGDDGVARQARLPVHTFSERIV